MNRTKNDWYKAQQNRIGQDTTNLYGVFWVESKQDKLCHFLRNQHGIRTVHWADSVWVIPSWIRVHFGFVLFYVHFNWIPRYVEWDNCRRWGPAFTLLYFSFHFYMLMFFVSSGVNKFECAWDLRDAFSKRNMMLELHEGQKSHLRSHISSFMTFCGTTIIGREKISRKIFIANHRDFEKPPECLSRWNYTRELNVHWSGLGFYSHVWS